MLVQLQINTHGLLGNHLSKPRLNARLIEGDMKIVVQGYLVIGVKVMFDLEDMFFLSEEEILLGTWGHQLNILGLLVRY